MTPKEKWSSIIYNKLDSDLQQTYNAAKENIKVLGYNDPTSVEVIDEIYNEISKNNSELLKRNAKTGASKPRSKKKGKKATAKPASVAEANMEEPPLPLDYGFGSSEFNKNTRKSPKPRVKKKGKKATKKAVAPAKPAKAKTTKTTKAKAPKKVKTVSAKKAKTPKKVRATKEVSINKKTLSKSDLVKVVSGSSAMPQTEVKKVVDKTLTAIEKSVKAGKNVQIKKFGTFKQQHRKAHKGIHPSTKKAITIKASTTVAFKPSENMKKGMNAKSYMEKMQERSANVNAYMAEGQKRVAKSKKK